MSFSFLHPEFFFWMLLPVGILFYFWQTQQPLDIRWFTPKVIERLRAREITMGLKGRNALFLAAALLLISAMAQPVAIQDTAPGSIRSNVLIAIDRSAPERTRFEATKSIAAETIGALKGENVGIVAYDTALYRVAPLSRQFFLLTSLVQNLGYDVSFPSDRSNALKTLQTSGSLQNIDAVLIVSAEASPEVLQKSPRLVAVIGSAEDIQPTVRALKVTIEHHRERWHIPLFFYPLGLAMLLILIALSSMSKRQTISLAAGGLILCGYDPSLEAGILDFKVLNEAEAAYERGEYRHSESLFAQYQQTHDSPQIRYNRANALFRQGRFDEALYWYRQVHTSDAELTGRVRHNMAVTVERMGKKEKTKEGDGDRVPTALQSDPGTDEPGMIKGGGKVTRLFSLP